MAMAVPPPACVTAAVAPSIFLRCEAAHARSYLPVELFIDRRAGPKHVGMGEAAHWAVKERAATRKSGAEPTGMGEAAAMREAAASADKRAADRPSAARKNGPDDGRYSQHERGRKCRYLS
jgi:hypothetical protein